MGNEISHCLSMNINYMHAQETHQHCMEVQKLIHWLVCQIRNLYFVVSVGVTSLSKCLILWLSVLSAIWELLSEKKSSVDLQTLIWIIIWYENRPGCVVMLQSVLCLVIATVSSWSFSWNCRTHNRYSSVMAHF